ncbi:MAG: LytTR family DNA-binding domain-containing protein [Defluviitaleaceae bacterium]|nr:LytTR family DNA-binding domain-containing protein [Defluviitaleaceae bacterium]
MLFIGICDSDTAVRAAIGDFARRYKEEIGINVQILAYNSGEKLLRHYLFELDLVFLEIPFAKMTGIEIARQIRAVDQNVAIVFLTSVLSHVFEAYDVRANNYLLKPLKYTRFLKEVEAARAKRGQNRFFIESNDSGMYKIYTKTLRYIETDGRNTKIYTENEGIISYKPMKTHQQTLYEPHFIRCHTGFIVNLLFFEKMEGNDIILTTGERIPVSRQRKKEVITQIMNLPLRGG